MKANKIKIGIVIGLVFLTTGIASAMEQQSQGPQAPYIIKNGVVQIDGGRMSIIGPPSNPHFEAAAKNYMTVSVGSSGSILQVLADYSMVCPGDRDDGCCRLEFLSTSEYKETWTGESSRGTLSIQKFVYPNDIISWKLTATYYDNYKLIVVGNVFDIGSAHTTDLGFDPIFNIPMESQVIASGEIHCVQ
jgi:hypothetical protein